MSMMERIVEAGIVAAIRVVGKRNRGVSCRDSRAVTNMIAGERKDL